MTEDLCVRVIRKLIAMSPILQRGFESRIQMNDDDATMIQIRSLALLSGGAMTISELARLRQVSLQTASETVKHLEEREWVERVRNPKDRRQWMITLTHAGLQQLEATQNYAVGQMVSHMDKMTDDEMQALDVALDALSRVFSIPDAMRISAEETKDAS